MAWIFRKARMLHVPRTAGHWVLGAARNAGIPGYLWWPKHTFRNESGGHGMFTFCVIRDPVDWYRSYFGHRNTPDARWGHKHEPWREFEEECQAGEINEFVERVHRFHPGYYSWIVEQYTGPADDEIEMVCRYEALKDGIVSAFKAAGEQFNETALRKTKRINIRLKNNPDKVSAANPHFMEMTEETKQLIIKMESSYYARWG